MSIWEIATKVAAGKYDAEPALILSGIVQAGLEELPISWRHSLAVRDLPLHHRDPFDRMLVAQAVTEPLRLVTSDRMLTRYGDRVLLV